MTWWKKLSESAQAYWLQIAKSCITDHPSVTDAWAVAQRVAARAIYAPQ